MTRTVRDVEGGHWELSDYGRSWTYWRGEKLVVQLSCKQLAEVSEKLHRVLVNEVSGEGVSIQDIQILAILASEPGTGEHRSGGET